MDLRAPLSFVRATRRRLWPLGRSGRVHLTGSEIAGEMGSTMRRRRQKQETASCSAASRVAFDAAQASSCPLLPRENLTICHDFSNHSAGGRIIKRRCSVLTVRRRMACLPRPKSTCQRVAWGWALDGESCAEFRPFSPPPEVLIQPMLN